MISRSASASRTLFQPWAALLMSACGAGGAESPDFASDAPVVIETSPGDGEEDVEASLAQITATFSEAMDLAGWSWVTEVGRSAPSITGLPFYVDEQTTVLPVRLEPSTTYVIWVNSPDDRELRNFTNHDGVSARAHRIRFTTRD
jgi:Bacterial Ig-like domain